MSAPPKIGSSPIEYPNQPNMKQQIIESINDAEKLETLYHQDQQEFEKYFSEISASYDTPLVTYWEIRLKHNAITGAAAVSTSDTTTGAKGDATSDETRLKAKTQLRNLFEVLAIAAFTAILVLIPALFTGVGKEFFYIRDIALIAFNGLIIYSFWLNKDSDLKNRFAPIAKAMAENEQKIVEELNIVQGPKVDIGGYYWPNKKKTAAAMRPSATLNGLLAKI